MIVHQEELDQEEVEGEVVREEQVVEEGEGAGEELASVMEMERGRWHLIREYDLT